MQGAEHLLFQYLKGQGKKCGHFGTWMTMLWPPSYSEADGGLSACHLGFTERCPSRGDPAVLGAIGGRFLLCPPSSSLPVASCGVINVCSTTSCLHTLTLGCQDMRAVSVSCRDWIKRRRVALLGQTDSRPGVRGVNVW